MRNGTGQSGFRTAAPARGLNTAVWEVIRGVRPAVTNAVPIDAPRAGAGQGATSGQTPSGTAVPLILFIGGGLFLLAGIAYAKEQLK